MNIEEENLLKSGSSESIAFFRVCNEPGGDGLTSIYLENRKSYLVTFVTFALIDTQLVMVLHPSDTSKKPISICLEVTLA